MSIKQRVEKELSDCCPDEFPDTDAHAGYINGLKDVLKWIKEESKPKNKTWKYTPRDKILALAMFARIRQKYIYAARPIDQFHQWSDDIRKIREKYKVGLNEIREIFLWAHNHHFWSKNIRSAAKLYKHFEELSAQRQDEQDRGYGANPHIR